MIAAVGGAAILVAALGGVGLGLGVMIVGRLMGRSRVARSGVRVVAGAVVGWAGFWALGWVTAPRGMVALGDEVSFCGIDCHLHVSVIGVTRGDGLGVRLRFRSDAKAAAEFPSFLRFAVRGTDGRRVAPSAGFVAEPLAAGATMERELSFSVPAAAGNPVLEVTWDSWLDYLVPGSGNVLVQRLRPLALSKTE